MNHFAEQFGNQPSGTMNRKLWSATQLALLFFVILDKAVANIDYCVSLSVVSVYRSGIFQVESQRLDKTLVPDLSLRIEI